MESRSKHDFCSYANEHRLENIIDHDVLLISLKNKT